MQPQARRPLAIFIIVLVVLVGATIGYNYLKSFQKLTVVIGSDIPSLKVSVYKLPPGGHESGPLSDFKAPKYLVRETTSSTTFKLKKGEYLVSSSGNNDYVEQDEEVHLDQPQQAKVDPQYTATKLASQLKQEASAINQAIAGAVPGVANYTVAGGKLYQRGEWYGTVLTVKQTAEQARTSYTDIYRLVAQKQNGTWKVVATPDLNLSIVTYPSIPRAVLVDVNKMKP
jgi:hypothetical protein